MRRAIVRSGFAPLLALLLAVGMAFGPLAAAAPAKVNMNLKGADVAEVFRALGDVGGLNIVLDPAVKGTLTVKLQDVTVDEALQLVAYATGVQYRVVGPSLIVTPKGAVSGLENPVTEKLSLRYAHTADVAAALAMAAPNTKLQPDVRTNSFIAQGPASEIEALRTVLSMLDVPIAPPEATQPAAAPQPVPSSVESVRIVQLKHAPAARVADVLKVMLDRAKVQPDERTNSIVFLADDDAWTRVQGIVAGLDVAVEPPADVVLSAAQAQAQAQAQAPAVVEQLPVEADVLKVIKLTWAPAAQIRAALAAVVTDVRMSQDERTNSLVVLGPREQLARIEEMVSLLDVAVTPAPTPAAAQPVEEYIDMIALSHADPVAVRQAILAVVPADKVIADVRTSAVIVIGTSAQHDRARQIAGFMDRAKPVETAAAPTPAAAPETAAQQAATAQPAAKPEPVPVVAPPVRSVKAFRLAHAEPEAVKKALSLVVPANAIEVDVRTRSVLMLALPDEHAIGADIVAMLDIELPAPAPVVTVAAQPAPEPAAADKPAAQASQEQPVVAAPGTSVVRLQHASAASVRESLVYLVPEIKVSADARTNSLILIGQEEAIGRARGLIGELDIGIAKEAPASPEAEAAEVVRLSYASPSPVKDALAVTMPASKISVDERTGSLVIVGTAAQRAAVREVIAKLDVELAAPAVAPGPEPEHVAVTAAPEPVTQPVAPAAPAGPETSIVRLQNATASAMRESIMYLVPELKVTADARTNSLVLLGPEEAVKRAKALINELDIAIAEAQPAAPVAPEAQATAVAERAPEPAPAEPEAHIVRLQNATASAMRESILYLVPELKVTADARTNSLVLLGPEGAVKKAKGLIGELDIAIAPAPQAAPAEPAPPATIAAEPAPEPAQPEPETYIVRLTNASATAVRENLAYLVPGLKVSSDTRTNSLIIIGSEHDVARAQALVAELDIAVAAPDTPEAPAPPDVESAEVIRLAYASPLAVRDALAPTIPASKISVDERTGSVVIVGTTAQREVAKGIIAKLDITVAAPVATAVADARPEAEELHVVTLKHASAAQVRQALAPVVPLANVTVDERTNSVIIVASESRAARALAVIDKLDVSMPEPVAAVPAAAPAAQTIPAEKPVVEQPVVMPHRVKNADAAGLKPAVGLLVASANIQIDSRTNTLVVLAEPSVQLRVAELVAGLDVPLPAAPAAPQPEPDAMRVFKLAHAAASDMRTLISSVVPASTIQADDRTSSLVVIAGASALARAEELIKTLDVPGAPEPPAPELPPEDPQVARVYRLNYADPKDMAAVLSGFVTGKVSPDERTASVAVLAPQSQHAQVLGLIEALDTALPQVLIEARLEELSGDAGKKLGLDWSFGGISLGHNSLGQIVDLSIDLLANLSILEEKGEASLISRQHTFTVDGKTGKILIGDRIPVLVQEVRDGQVVNRVDFINAGVELSITPKVTNDGSITASVKPVISSIVGWTPQNYPQIRTRELETIVSLKSGQTAVIGGLLHRDEIENLSKVPILGDIPLLGELFKKKTVTSVDTEVVMLITAWQVNPDQRTVVGPAQPGDTYPVSIQPVNAPAPGAN